MSDTREDGAAFTLLGGDDCTMNGMFGVYRELLGRAEVVLDGLQWEGAGEVCPSCQAPRVQVVFGEPPRSGPHVVHGETMHRGGCTLDLLLADIRRALG